VTSSNSPDSPLEVLLQSLRASDLPVKVAAVAARLGLSIERRELDGAAALLDMGARKIILPVCDSRGQYQEGYTARDRFSIAHELAHLLCQRWPHVMPRGFNGIEKLCDYLAGEILMPRNVILPKLSPDPTPSQALELLLGLNVDAYVSYHAAAMRLRDFVTTVGYVCLRPQQGVEWYSGVAPAALARLSSHIDAQAQSDGQIARASIWSGKGELIAIRSAAPSRDWRDGRRNGG
jgi:hypothetical protein